MIHLGFFTWYNSGRWCVRVFMLCLWHSFKVKPGTLLYYDSSVAVVI